MKVKSGAWQDEDADQRRNGGAQECEVQRKPKPQKKPNGRLPESNKETGQEKATPDPGGGAEMGGNPHIENGLFLGQSHKPRQNTAASTRVQVAERVSIVSEAV